MSHSDLSVAKAQVAGLFAESILYGIYVITCGFCGRALVTIDSPPRWRNRDELRWVIIIAALLLVVNSTANLVLQFCRVLLAFGDDALELGNVSSWVNVGKTSTYVVQPCIGDAILIYRCYVVYNHSWKIVLPSLVLWVGGIFCAARGLAFQAVLNAQGTTINSSDIRSYSLAFSCITVSQNIITSSLLIWRFWRVERQNRQFAYRNDATTTHSSHREPPSKLMKVIRIIMESGLLITVSSTASLACRASATNAVYPATCIEFICVAIGFNLIIIRTTATHRSSGDTSFTTPSIPLHFRPSSMYQSSHSASDGAGRPKHELRVVVTRSLQRTQTEESPETETPVKDHELVTPV